MKAFTLAEVIITLGIIGIVAAMTIPELINTYRKRAIETSVKETYSILHQAMKLAEFGDSDLSYFPDSAAGVKDWFSKVIQPSFKYTRVCFGEAGCWHKSGTTKTLSNQTAYADRKELGLGDGNLTLRLYNGANICIDGVSSGSFKNTLGNVPDATLAIYIDANGDKLPNVIGKDIYVLVYSTSEGLVPAGFGLPVEEIDQNCSNLSSSSNAGYYCLLKLKNNGWKL